MVPPKNPVSGVGVTMEKAVVDVETCFLHDTNPCGSQGSLGHREG